MSIVHHSGARRDLRERQERIDTLLAHRMVIGYRRWAMAQLYYRAGLTQQEIGDIFGITRQNVSYELSASFREVAEHLASVRDERGRQPTE